MGTYIYDWKEIHKHDWREINLSQILWGGGGVISLTYAAFAQHFLRQQKPCIFT